VGIKHAHESQVDRAVITFKADRCVKPLRNFGKVERSQVVEVATKSHRWFNGIDLIEISGRNGPGMIN
jgi:hypothetical protein